MEVMAILLAGGKGKRLGAITRELSKPAILFGGSHRLIDFPLSNCTNSGIYCAGVLTRHPSKAQVLGKILEDGRRWGFPTGEREGLFVRPERFLDEYQGTAHAVYQNLDFIDAFGPEQVLILCTDHVYKMHYGKMLTLHRQKKAQLTIAAFQVPRSQASRFGIMGVNNQGRVVTFEEKPKYPSSDLVSMGVYIFEAQALQEYLEEDQRDSLSHHDFGKNIIPKMVWGGARVFAYPFHDYWKDVGTVDDFWQANMDLVTRNFSIHQEEWPIYSSDGFSPLEFLHDPEQNIFSSLISREMAYNGAVQIENSIISSQVWLGEESVIRNSVLMPGVDIEGGERIENSLVCSASQITGPAGSKSSIPLMEESEQQKGLLLVRS